jgi:hypothetical protein
MRNQALASQAQGFATATMAQVCGRMTAGSCAPTRRYNLWRGQHPINELSALGVHHTSASVGHLLYGDQEHHGYGVRTTPCTFCVRCFQTTIYRQKKGQIYSWGFMERATVGHGWNLSHASWSAALCRWSGRVGQGAGRARYHRYLMDIGIKHRRSGHYEWWAAPGYANTVRHRAILSSSQPKRKKR